MPRRRRPRGARGAGAGRLRRRGERRRGLGDGRPRRGGDAGRAGEQLVVGQARRREDVDGDVPGGALGVRPPVHLHDPAPAREARLRGRSPQRRRREEGRGPVVRLVTGEKPSAPSHTPLRVLPL
uniref:Uncharacterized protein n=1 Tax=Setaria viridis TaxID=4556 RepID=A0A4V6D6U7_SETVI|nr:hypothetical protein SEVIR_5G261850v2 [Setaria viridis]